MLKTIITVYCVRCTHCNPVNEKPKPLEFDSAERRAWWIAAHLKYNTRRVNNIFKWTEPREARV